MNGKGSNEGVKLRMHWKRLLHLAEEEARVEAQGGDLGGLKEADCWSEVWVGETF